MQVRTLVIPPKLKFSGEEFLELLKDTLKDKILESIQKLKATPHLFELEPKN